MFNVLFFETSRFLPKKPPSYKKIKTGVSPVLVMLSFWKAAILAA